MEHLLNNKAQQEYITLLLTCPNVLQNAIVAYAGLFRRERDLTDSKQLSILKGVLALPYTSHATLATALCETVDAIQAKEQSEPLTNHNYLKKVMGSVEARSVQTAQRIPSPEKTDALPKSKTMVAISSADDLKGEYR